MQIPYEWRIGWRYIRQSKALKRNGFIAFISGISMLGIALGVAALIVVLSVMNGFQKEVRDRMLNVIPHVEVTSLDGDKLVDLKAIEQIVKQEPGVVRVDAYTPFQGLLARGEALQGTMVYGVDPQTYALPQGSPLLKPGEFGVILGSALANHLGVVTGDKVILLLPQGQMTLAGLLPRFKTLTVAGVVSFNHYEFDAGLAVLHIQDAETLLRLEAPSSLRMQLSDAQQARAVHAELEQKLSAFRVNIEDWTSHNKTWFAAVQVEKRMMFIILTLIVAVAAFNLVSTLVMAVTDKQSDIAILKTLGATPRSIMSIFMVQGTVVGTMGTLVGLAVGLLIAYNVGAIVSVLEHLFNVQFLPADIYFISQMPSDPRMGDIAPVVLIAWLLSLLATIYPSLRASKVAPAEALRYE